MFRLSHYMHELVAPTAPRQRSGPVKPVVIWNLTRTCNLRCRHCYTTSADVPFPGELTHEQALAVLDDLAGFGIPALILSGGEPLSRFDFFPLAERARELGFRHLSLSTNGTRVAENIDLIAGLGFDYVGISLDGIGAMNDWFRGMDGAYQAALDGVRACKARGVKVGLRFTLTEDNARFLPQMIDLCEAEGVDKFYLSHLVYAGRGNKNRGDDAVFAMTRAAMDLIFERAWADAARGVEREYVTGNNDADGVYLLHWVERRFPDRAAHIRAKLVQWGGNSSGVNVANIDNLGNVHPDTFWWHYGLGNVRDRPFSAIWTDLSDPIMAGLKTNPRRIEGRCGGCAHFDICGGNTRIRALQLTGNAWAEDPGCYLDDAEIGVTSGGERVALTPYRGRSHATLRA